MSKTLENENLILNGDISGEVGAACERTIAFALVVRGCTADEAVAAIRAAHRARLAGIFLLASPAFAEEATEAVRLAGKTGRMMVQAVECDFAATPDIFEVIRMLCESALDTYEAALVIDAARDGIDDERIAELCRVGRSTDDSQTPCLITRNDLESHAA